MTSPLPHENTEAAESRRTQGRNSLEPAAAHPVWMGFIRFCQEFRFGEIEKLKIQYGLPVLAEVTKKKVRFAP